MKLATLQGRRRRFGILLACQYQNRVQYRRRARVWFYPRPQYWFEQLLNDRNQDHLWKEHFRVNRNTFNFICGVVGPQIRKQNTVFRQAISIEKRVAIALWRLGTGNSYRTIGQSFGVGRATAMKIKDSFCSALLDRINDFIKFPRTEAETRKCIEGFQNISTFPQVVGALDGSHIPIATPMESPNEYVNRKQFHSIILQGVADSDKKFLHVSTGYAGSIHDARVLRISSLFTAVENNTILNSPVRRIRGREVKPLLVADPAYRLTTWSMKPYPQARGITARQAAFNKSLSSARVVIEQAFGLLKGRWRCLLHNLNESVEKVSYTIIACCILHNICLNLNDDTDVDIVNDGNINQANPGHVINQDGANLRDHIKNTLF